MEASSQQNAQQNAQLQLFQPIAKHLQKQGYPVSPLQLEKALALIIKLEDNKVENTSRSFATSAPTTNSRSFTTSAQMQKGSDNQNTIHNNHQITNHFNLDAVIEIENRSLSIGACIGTSITVIIFLFLSLIF